MIRKLAPLLYLLAAGSWSVPSAASSASDWEGYFWISRDQGMESAAFVGARPGWSDGYDGQTSVNIEGQSGVGLFHYRSAWAGPTGFFTKDYESPIPPGGSKTWPDIYLWSQNYTPQLGDRVEVVYSPEGSPLGWWKRIVLDYVPPHLDWQGPWEWWLPLYQGWRQTLPVPITDEPYNPDNVTRLHLEVYSYPIPEPSSLAALGLALAGVGIGVVRRRR